MRMHQLHVQEWPNRGTLRFRSEIQRDRGGAPAIQRRRAGSMKAADLDAVGEIEATMATLPNCPDPCDPQAAWDSSHGPPFAGGSGGTGIARSLWKVTYSCFKKVVKPSPPPPPPPPQQCWRPTARPATRTAATTAAAQQQRRPTTGSGADQRLAVPASLSGGGERLPAMPEHLRSDPRYRFSPQPTRG